MIAVVVLFCLSHYIGVQLLSNWIRKVLKDKAFGVIILDLVGRQAPK